MLQSRNLFLNRNLLTLWRKIGSVIRIFDFLDIFSEFSGKFDSSAWQRFYNCNQTYLSLCYQNSKCLKSLLKLHYWKDLHRLLACSLMISFVLKFRKNKYFFLKFENSKLFEYFLEPLYMQIKVQQIK